MRQGLETLSGGRVDQVLPTRVQAIEAEDSERQLRAHAFDIEFTAEAAYGHLERVRGAIGLEGEGFAVKDEVLHRQLPHCLRDFRCGRGNLVESARVDAHIIARRR